MVIECDELWSFVGKKARKQWIWIAMDRESRLVVAMHIGSRGLKGAKGLWQNLPESYREQALFYTDFWEAYRAILLRERHRAVGNGTGLTNHIERLNLTLGQRVSKLGRKTLSFSKNHENHIGAIRNFIHHYNQSILQI